MKAVAAAAVFFSLMASQPAIPALLLLVTAYAVPITVAAWRGRHLTAALIAAALPASSIACLYSAWLTAWIAVGHRPVPGLDDPGSITNPFARLFMCLLSFSILGFLIGPFAGLMLGIERRVAGVDRRTLIAGDSIGLLLTPAMIFATIAVAGWDPFGILDWIMD